MKRDDVGLLATAPADGALGATVLSQAGPTPTVARTHDLLPRRLGRYKLIERLGAGAMGVV